MTIQDWTYYDPTGRILMTATLAPEEAEITSGLNGGWAYIAGKSDMDRDYVAHGVVQPRPANTARLDGMTLIRIPQPSTIIIDGAEYRTTLSVETLEFDQPGTYQVRVASWPHLDAEFEVVYGD